MTQLRFLIVGDYHGTSEVPALVGDLVCDALQRGREIDLGLEWPASTQADIDVYLAADGSQEDREALVRALGGAQDGRMSDAMIDLVEHVRRLKHAGGAVSLTAIQPQPGPGPNHERVMAEHIIAANQAGELSIVLVGNLHAMKAASPQLPDLEPMASFLPGAATVTINTVGYYGEAWNCRQPDGTGNPICRAWPLRQGHPGPRRVTLGHEEGGRFDGRYSVGVPFTASAPAAGQ